MTPQERKLIDELFDRLQSLEEAPRDEAACDAINAGLDRAPNALYPLVQTVLVQDEALKRAAARIHELESQLGGNAPQGSEPSSFLDSMRESMGERRERQGSVPQVGGKPNVWGPAYNQSENSSRGQPAYGQQQWGGEQPQPQAQPQQQGGSFLGTAAATVAGVVGGALLMNSFKGMFGGQQPGQKQGVFDQPSGDSPWSSSSGGDLARQAGLDDIGKSGRTAAYDDSNTAPERVGMFDDAHNDEEDDFDFEDDGDDGGDFEET